MAVCRILSETAQEVLRPLEEGYQVETDSLGAKR